MGKLESVKEKTKIKLQGKTIILLGFFLFIGSIMGFAYFKANASTFYYVYVDGKEIGKVSTPDIVEEWKNNQVDSFKKKFNANLDIINQITYQKENKLKGSYDNQKTLLSLEKLIDFQVKGIQLSIDGEIVGVVKDQETLNRVITSVKNSYINSQDAKSKVKSASLNKEALEESIIENIEVKENIETKNVSASIDKLIAENQLESLLKKGNIKEQTYTIQEGDTISEIAFNNGLSTSEIYQLNPNLKGELINIGDKIKISKLQPMITVKTTEKLIKEEDIDYEIEYQKDGSMYNDQTKIIQQGEEGKKRVEYKVIKENGLAINKIILNEEIISEPQKKIVKVGSKIRNNGTLLLPTAGGVITSKYGPRWGGTHRGLDISGVTDRNIRAAESGKVIFAGWKGGYGYAVIIDHGEGLVTLYAHHSKLKVTTGDYVKRGQAIGIMGTTGNSTGVHLHLEVKVNGVNKNPLRYVTI